MSKLSFFFNCLYDASHTREMPQKGRINFFFRIKMGYVKKEKKKKKKSIFYPGR